MSFFRRCVAMPATDPNPRHQQPLFHHRDAYSHRVLILNHQSRCQSMLSFLAVLPVDRARVWEPPTHSIANNPRYVTIIVYRYHGTVLSPVSHHYMNVRYMKFGNCTIVIRIQCAMLQNPAGFPRYSQIAK